MVWSVFEVENGFVDSERVVINGIPCLKFRPRGAGALPTIIFYHGWQSSKEHQRFRAAVLALYGYQVVVPDAVYHGERDPVDHQNSAVLEEYFWPVVLQNVREAPGLLEYILGNLNTAEGRIGVMGSSMGGFSAAGIFAAEPLLKALVVFNGSCAWIKAEEILREERGGEPLTAAARQRLAGYDPLMNKAALKGRPILMLHGETDTSVPIACQEVFYRETAPLYCGENEDSLQLIRFPNLNHHITTGMLALGIEWLKKHL